MEENEVRETVRQTFEAIAEHFDKTRYKPWPETVEYVESLPERSRVLDIGCGNGRNMILPRRLGHEVVGIDFSMNLLKIAQEKLEMRELDEETHLLGGDAAIMPLKDDTFDSALYIATLHHIPSEEDRLNSLKDLKRCLKPGGMDQIPCGSCHGLLLQAVNISPFERGSTLKGISGSCIAKGYNRFPSKGMQAFRNHYRCGRLFSGRQLNQDN